MDWQQIQSDAELMQIRKKIQNDNEENDDVNAEDIDFVKEYKDKKVLMELSEYGSGDQDLQSQGSDFIDDEEESKEPGSRVPPVFLHNAMTDSSTPHGGD